MSTITFTVVSGQGAKRKSQSMTMAATNTVQDLKKQYAKLCHKSIHRLSFKKEIAGSDKPMRLDDDRKTLESYGIVNDDTITFKDLGPQIDYRTVFVVEYAGPLFIMLFYTMRPSFIFGEDASKQEFNWVAKLAIACWVLHFVKREYETFFIHKFSRPTMPLQNLYKNCTYYWAFGAVIGIPLCATSYVAPTNEALVYAGLAIFLVSQVGNLICHIMLSKLRKAEGSNERPIPRGFLFELVSCPNYTFEVLAWVGFSIMTQIPYAFLFTVVGAVQMADWAQKKHQGYKKTDEKYKALNRKAIFPFIY